MSEPTRVVLTDDQMETIHQVSLADSEDYEVDIILAVWKEVMGHDEWERADRVNPTEWAIPKAQTLQISEWGLAAQDRILGQLAAVNFLLTWMNAGPSTYEED